MIGVPSDPWVVKWMARQHRLHAEQATQRLCHAAESYGRPGSLTVSGQQFKLAATEAGEHNLLGLLYAIQHGWIGVGDVGLPDLDEPVGKVAEVREYTYS